MVEILIVVLIGVALLAVPVLALIFSVVALVRSGRVKDLTQRIALLEDELRRPERAGGQGLVAAPVTGDVPAEASGLAAVEVVDTVPSSTAPEAIRSGAESRSGAAAGMASWETFIGQKAFGWLAVILFLCAAAFFLRHAYQNNWIGPVGRVAIGELAGAALLVAGWGYHRRGWRRFAHMLTAGGVVVLYLATYSAFGFYDLLPQFEAAGFLALLVLESMLLAVLYRSAGVALMAVLGGLVTPLVLHSVRDAYTELFLYLTVLNSGVILALARRGWSGIGSVAYLGTQGLYWLWFTENYHPEKLGPTLGFQVGLFALYLAHDVAATWLRPTPFRLETLARFLLCAIIGFVAVRQLVRVDYDIWLGSIALALATLYAAVARLVLVRRWLDDRLLLTSLAISVGFVAWAFPLQAEANWVALGWAAMGTALWWFGLRIDAARLRWLAAVLGTAAVVRLLLFDLPVGTRDPFTPIFNRFALPSLGVAAGILGSVLLADRFPRRQRSIEQWGVAVAAVAGVLLLWLILSVECYGYFDSQSIGSEQVLVWRWRGQLALSVFWTLYATILLWLGFWLQRTRLRWLAMALYGATVIKLFVVDMANVQHIYRILAFFVLSVVLAWVAKVYQRFK